MKHFRTCLFVAALLLFLSKEGWSQLTLTIDEYTTDRLTLTISGNLEFDTGGNFEGWLSVKNDWENNQGIHTEIWSSLPTIEANSVTIGGTPVSAFIENGTNYYNDSVYWQNPGGFSNPISALTIIGGSVTLSGTNIFDPINNTALNLVSGLNTGIDDWFRLEAVATAIPEPSVFSLTIGTVGLLVTIWWRRNRGTD